MIAAATADLIVFILGLCIVVPMAVLIHAVWRAAHPRTVAEQAEQLGARDGERHGERRTVQPPGARVMGPGLGWRWASMRRRGK